MKYLSAAYYRSVFLWLRCGVCSAAAYLFFPSLASAATVTINGAQTFQTIDGFGVNANHRSWNGTELQPVLDSLIDEGGMTLFRVIYDKADWEESNDNTDPDLMDWSYYNSVYSTAEFQKLWDLVAYLNQRGVSNGIVFNFQGQGPAWLMNSGRTALAPGGEAEWAEMIASLVIYARTNRNLNFHLLAPDNEEDITIQGISMNSSQYVTALHTLARLLDTNGLSDMRFIGPDLGYSSSNWLSAMMDDPLVIGKVAHFGLHSYQDNGGGSAGFYNFIKQSAEPRSFWMTEFNAWCSGCESGQGGDDSWAYASSAARYLYYHLANGASAGIIWEGYDSQYNYYNPGQWSYWGLFGVDDIDASPKTYTPRKTFYTISQFSKFVRPGARRIGISGSLSPLLVLAFYNSANGHVTLVGLNAGASNTTLSGSLLSLPAIPSFDLYYTTAATNLAHGATFDVTNGAFSLVVPPKCVFTFVGQDPAFSAVSVDITNPVDGAWFSTPTDILLQASVSNMLGTIGAVTFYDETNVIADVSSAPYEVVWTNAPAGVHRITAGVTNSLGYFAISPAVQVTVAGPLASIDVTPGEALIPPSASRQFFALAKDALGTALHPQPSFSWSVTGGGTIDSNGLFSAAPLAGGPFTVSATCGEVQGTATVTIATGLNLAPFGKAYSWYGMESSTANAPQVVAPELTDGDVFADVPLLPGGGDVHLDFTNAYEAAGVIWSTPQTLSRVVYVNGSYTPASNGVFVADFQLQFSPDGGNWADAPSAWTVSPEYAYNSGASANVSFAFTGAVATVQGVRCVGRVHSGQEPADSGVAFATEIEAYAPPPPEPPPVLSISLADDGAVSIAWPLMLTNFNLETTTNLGFPSAWLTITNVPQPAGDQQSVSLPPLENLQLFRLHRQE